MKANSGRHNTPDKCELCEESVSNMTKHLKNHTKNEPWPCSKCPLIFSREIKLFSHQHKTHGNSLQCKTCFKVFPTLTSFIRHVRLCHIEKRYSCDSCGFSSYYKAHLQKHIEQVHNKKCVFFCDTCPKGFPEKYLLEQHLNLHSGKEPFQCELCGKGFRLRSTLYKHRNRDHFELYEHGCHICRRGFASVIALQSHIKLIHLDRKFVCEVCNKTLSTAVSLQDHMRIHTGETPFSCSLCPKAYRARKQLIRHIGMHHTPTSTKNQFCRSCGKSFNCKNSQLCNSCRTTIITTVCD